MFNKIERRYLEVLRRRQAWLDKVIADYNGKDPSYAKHELAALTWILTFVESFDQEQEEANA